MHLHKQSIDFLKNIALQRNASSSTWKCMELHITAIASHRTAMHLHWECINLNWEAIEELYSGETSSAYGNQIMYSTDAATR